MASAAAAVDQARAFMYFGVSVMEDDPRASLDAMLECAALTSKAGVRPIQGLALANASEGAVDLGEWEVADRALDEIADLMRNDSIDDDGGILTRAMLTAHRGDPEAALAALVDLEARRSTTWKVVQMHTWFLRVRSLCQFLAGDPDGAADTARMSLRLDPVGGNAPSPLWIAIHAASPRRESSEIRAALEATAALRGHWTALVRATATAVISCLEHDGDAATGMTAALDAWSSADLPLDHAFATLSAMYVLPPADVPIAHVDRARAYLTDLHAASLLTLYDAAPG